MKTELEIREAIEKVEKVQNLSEDLKQNYDIEMFRKNMVWVLDEETEAK